MKLDDILSLVQESILTHASTLAPKELAAKVLKEIQKVAADEKADRAATPGKKAKSQFFVVSTTAGLGYVLQLEAEAVPTDVTSRIQAAATDFNNSKRGRKVPVATVGETLENVPAKFFKTNDGKKCLVKTKSAVAVLTIPNALAK
jgi:hypothetical protein